MALEKMPAAEQGMLELGYSRQFWNQILFQQVFNWTAPSMQENGSKILETNTKAQITDTFQILLKGPNPPNRSGLPYNFISPWRTRAAHVRAPASLLTSLCVSPTAPAGSAALAAV